MRTILIALLVATATTSCFAPSFEETHCGGNVDCPAEYTCTSLNRCTLCGDGIADVENGEECDDGNTSDADDCLHDCRLPTCGDGIVRSDAADPADREDCDSGAVDTAECDEDCSRAICGDGYINAVRAEVCDDGNTASADGCKDDCSSDESCGNGIEDIHLPKNPTTNPNECLSATAANTGCAEVCDDGNATSGDGCSSNCLSEETCRNHIVDPLGNGLGNPPEICDDGNQIDSDACRNDCRGGAGCGNGLVDILSGEQCDSGLFETATCDYGADRQDPQNCTLPVCGDGHRNALAGEACDPGAPGTNVASCDADCTLPLCGDNQVNTAAGEQCDTGAIGVSTSTCDRDCTVPVCGDGFVNVAAGETCEDGNTTNTDNCAFCRLSICGDGITDLAAPGVETCDDGNANNNDACPNDCTIP